MTPMLALYLAYLVGVPTSGPSAAPSPAVITSWLGVSLNEAAKDVRAALGKPREVVESSVGQLWRYDIDNGNVTLELIIDQDQVLNIAARVKSGKHSSLADPFGAALGMAAQSLQTTRGTPLASYDNGTNLAYGEAAGVRWFYSLDDGAVSGIEVSNPLPAPPPAQVIGDGVHDGSTLDKALQVKAVAQGDVTNAELAYLHKMQCDGGGSWQVTGQELVPAGGRFFDLLHVACSTTKLPRDYYFDITNSFGR